MKDPSLRATYADSSLLHPALVSQLRVMKSGAVFEDHGRKENGLPDFLPALSESVIDF
jgi:hypothetical protein